MGTSFAAINFYYAVSLKKNIKQDQSKVQAFDKNQKKGQDKDKVKGKWKEIALRLLKFHLMIQYLKFIWQFKYMKQINIYIKICSVDLSPC